MSTLNIQTVTTTALVEELQARRVQQSLAGTGKMPVPTEAILTELHVRSRHAEPVPTTDTDGWFSKQSVLEDLLKEIDSVEQREALQYFRRRNSSADHFNGVRSIARSLYSEDLDDDDDDVGDDF